MIYLLFFLVLLLAIFCFFLLNRDLLSPSFWACIMFLIGIIINIINIYRWGDSYSIKSIDIIMLGLICIMCGEFIVTSLNRPRYMILKKTLIYHDHKNKLIIINNVKLTVILIVMLACLFIDIRSMNRALNVDNIFTSLYGAAHTSTGGSFIRRLVVAINKGFSYCFIYFIFYNKIICRSKIPKKFFLPIIIYCVNALINTGRIVFIRLIVYTLFLFILFYVRNHGNRMRQVLRVFIVGVVALMGFFLIFTLMGNLLGKGIYNSAIDVIYYYTGSSIYTFNQYVVQGGTSPSYFGEHTLYGIYNILHYLISSIPHVNNPSLEVTYIPHWYSNIYTAFRRYYQDFGWAGMVVIPTFLGMFYTKLKIWAQSDETYGWKCIFFAYSIYPIIEIAIEERFFMTYLSFSTCFELVVMYCIYKFVMRVNLVFGKR